MYPLRLPKGLFEADPELAELALRQAGYLAGHVVAIASESLPPGMVVRDIPGLLALLYNEGWWWSKTPTGGIKFDGDAPATGGFYYYQGNVVNALVESCADTRLCQALGLTYGTDAWGTTRPPSGSIGNLWLFFGLLDFGDPVVVMEGAAAHLTHLSPASVTSKLWNLAGRYRVNPDTGEIDWDHFEQVLRETKPRAVIVDGTALPTAVNFRQAREIVDRVSAAIGHHILLIADVAHKIGFIMAKVGTFANRDYQPQWWCDAISFTTQKSLESDNGACLALPNIQLVNDRGWTVNPPKGGGSRPQFYWERLASAIFPGASGKNPVDRSFWKAYSLRRALTPDYAKRMAGVLARQQILASVLHANGIPLIGSDNPSLGGDCHFVVVNLAKLPGAATSRKIAGAIEQAGAFVNINTVVGEPENQSPMNPPGLRIGALGAAGIPEGQWERVCQIMAEVIRDPSRAPVFHDELSGIARANFPYRIVKPNQADLVPDDVEDDSDCNAHGEGGSGSGDHHALRGDVDDAAAGD